MLSKLSEHIFQINSIILEINNMINQYNCSSQNKMNNFDQMNNNLFNINMNFNPFCNNLNQQDISKQKINVSFDIKGIQNKYNKNRTNLVLDRDFPINEALKLFLKDIGREDCITNDDLLFYYNGRNINFNDKRKIKELSDSFFL